MPGSIHFYQDQVLAEGRTAVPLAAARRILFCRFGAVEINGEALAAGQSRYVDDDMAVAGAADWSQLWRWEVDLPNAEPARLDGTGVLSLHRMSRVIGMLRMEPGSEWLFRLDRITAPAGRVTDPHQHPGPGIRCMMEGTFNVQQDCESVRAVNPGDPWWESGRDEVIAWGSKTMHARFLRGMVLPAEHAGAVTGTWKAGGAQKKRGNWELLVDRIVRAPEGGD